MDKTYTRERQEVVDAALACLEELGRPVPDTIRALILDPFIPHGEPMVADWSNRMSAYELMFYAKHGGESWRRAGVAYAALNNFRCEMFSDHATMRILLGEQQEVA